MGYLVAQIAAGSAAHPGRWRPRHRHVGRRHRILNVTRLVHRTALELDADLYQLLQRPGKSSRPIRPGAFGVNPIARSWLP